jgi:hypothetical protein
MPERMETVGSIRSLYSHLFKDWIENLPAKVIGILRFPVGLGKMKSVGP